MSAESPVVLESDYRDYYGYVFACRTGRPGGLVLARRARRRGRPEQYRMLTDAGIPCVPHGYVRDLVCHSRDPRTLIVDRSAERPDRSIALPAKLARRCYPDAFASEFILEATRGIGPVTYRLVGVGASRSLFRCTGYHPFKPIWRDEDGLVQIWEPASVSDFALDGIGFPFPLWQVTLVPDQGRLLGIRFTTSPQWSDTELFRFMPPTAIHREIRDWLLARRDRSTETRPIRAAEDLR